MLMMYYQIIIIEDLKNISEQEKYYSIIATLDDYFIDCYKIDKIIIKCSSMR